MKIILYSTNCPKCNILKAKLKSKNIKFIENNNIDLMIAKGFMTAPILEIDNKTLNYSEAINWIKERYGN